MSRRKFRNTVNFIKKEKKSMKRVSATQTGRLTRVRRLNAAKKQSIRHKYCTRRHGGGTIKQIKKKLDILFFSRSLRALCLCARRKRTKPNAAESTRPSEPTIRDSYARDRDRYSMGVLSSNFSSN